MIYQMKKISKKMCKWVIITLLPIFTITITLQSCKEIIEILSIIDALTGWLAGDEKMDDIPEDITPFDDGDGGALASKVSLEHLFPPIGDQGQYGTCVAWSVGYNLKTALNAIEHGWTQNQLSSTSNQASPQDLWWSIDKKGSNCNGTNFEPALDAIIINGVASLAAVPYPTKVNCSKTSGGDPKNKLANYRKIASEKQGLEVNNFKGYLNAGRPIAIGAKLGDRFMKWKDASTISMDTYEGKNMQHAYHAMALVGYDDSKNAFRVRNSWGTSWGDNGSIWVDYNFFCESFCFAAFVAQNANLESFGSTNVTEGTDLLAFYADDYDYNGDDHFTRTFEYEIYNSGTNDILPSQRWTVTYMYYNAFNAKEYEIIFDDYYTNEFGKEGEDGYWDDARGLVGGWWNYVTLYSGESIGDDFVINYVMPKITGSYYLVVMADAYDVIREVNEDNNFYFITAENGKPLEYINGVVQNMPSKSGIQTKSKEIKPELFANTVNQTTVKSGNLNSYTPQEIKTLLLHDKKTGKLDAKIKAYKENGGNIQKVKK